MHTKLIIVYSAGSTEGDIILSNGLTPYEGTVEVCLGGSWRGVCDQHWDHKDAYVICRQLEYPATGICSHGKEADHC